ncbi:MAG: SipW-dependent-type signal peptide-containing protein [Oscillospiraceae bacterium]|nr:MAG: SipW-dependent-type signal peptide-containing protein [Oscillospiraceae bacterium]
MTSKSTKRALISSTLAILMCAAMLIGTTFAWFTDTASTAVNKIQAGNLDVKLMYSTDMVTWKEATDQTKLFEDSALWEPGYTQVVYLKVVNAGNLALKYEAGFSKNYTSNRGKNVNGDWYRVDNYLKIGIAETETKFENREAVWSAIATTEKTLAKDFMLTDGWITLKAGESSKPFAMAIYMPTSVGNEANASRLRPSSVSGLGIEVRATQATVESDSFGTDYDANAATVLKRVEYTDGEHTVTGNIQANGTSGAIHGTGTAKITVDATTVYGTYVSDYAMAVFASGKSEITIKGGEFANQAPAGSALSLIYAQDNAKITIEGGTFKCVSPAWTLNCNDSDPATITVKGGSFYKFDPSNVTVGEGEIFIADGYKVVQNGDWYNVVPE